MPHGRPVRGAMSTVSGFGQGSRSLQGDFRGNGVEAHDGRLARVCFRALCTFHNSAGWLTYDLRAEIPGTFHALPVLGHAMYVPEIRCNSGEIRITVNDRPEAGIVAVGD